MITTAWTFVWTVGPKISSGCMALHCWHPIWILHWPASSSFYSGCSAASEMRSKHGNWGALYRRHLNLNHRALDRLRPWIIVARLGLIVDALWIVFIKDQLCGIWIVLWLIDFSSSSSSASDFGLSATDFESSSSFNSSSSDLSCAMLQLHRWTYMCTDQALCIFVIDIGLRTIVTRPCTTLVVWLCIVGVGPCTTLRLHSLSWT